MVISQGPDFSGGSSFGGGETTNQSSQDAFEPVAIVGMGKILLECLTGTKLI